MAIEPGPRPHVEWRLAEQHFNGTAEEVAVEIDRLIVALIALRKDLPVALRLGEDTRAGRSTGAVARFLSVIGLTGCLSLVAASLGAQPANPAETGSREPWRDVTFGLTFEGYYEANANHPDDRVNALRAYDTRADTFGVQQVASVVELEPDAGAGRRFGLRLDLQAGQATETTQGNPANEPRPDAYRHIWQAYGSFVFPVGRGLRADFGKFASSLGYETNYAKDNQAYSRAFLFTFLPFYHTGLRVTLPASDTLSVMYALTNGVQQTEDFNGFTSNHVWATLKPSPRVVWTIGYYAGREHAGDGGPDDPDGMLRVFDTYVTVTLTPRLTLGFDVNHTTNQFQEGAPTLSLDGLGAYFRAGLTARTAAGVRYEWLDDEGLFSGVDQRLQEVTLTLEHRVADGLLGRVEYRYDWSDRAYFPSEDGLRPRQPTLLVGAVWWVGSKVGAW